MTAKNERTCCVYMTVNLLNGMRYIGRHIGDVYADGYAGSGSRIGRALKEFGRKSFVVGVLEWCTLETLAVRERHWIQHFNADADSRYYNLAKGGNTLGRLCHGQNPALVNAEIAASDGTLFHREHAPNGCGWRDCPIFAVLRRACMPLEAGNRHRARVVRRNLVQNREWLSYHGWSLSRTLALAVTRQRARNVTYTVFHPSEPNGFTGTVGEIAGRFSISTCSVHAVLKGKTPAARGLVRDQASLERTIVRAQKRTEWKKERSLPRLWFHNSIAPSGIMATPEEIAERFGIAERMQLNRVHSGGMASHRGWSIRPIKRAKVGVLFRLINESGEITGTQAQIRAATGLSRPALSELCSGKRQQVKGWRLCA